MFRGSAAILMLMALALPSYGQDDGRIHALKNRVRLGPRNVEDFLVDPLEEFEPAAAARFAGQLLSPFPQHATSGYELLAGAILERIASDRYEVALTEYRNLLQDDAAKMLHRPLREFRGTDGLTSRDAHAFAQELLAKLPPSVLRRYLDRNDADASRLLADGAANHDVVALRRLVRDFRPSPQANKAFALLGDHSFERGDFEEALDWWRRLAPLPSHELVNRRGGDPKLVRDGVDLVRIHAKQALALLFAGQPDAARECEAFRTLYPDERGSLGGRSDAYHAILSHWRHELAKTHEREVDGAWPTFAGSPSRNRLLGKAPNYRLWLDGPAWRVPLPALGGKDPPPVWLSATRSLTVPPTPYDPIVAEGQVLISDGQSVRSFDLLTGKPRFRTEVPPPVMPRERVKRPANPNVDEDDATPPPPAVGTAFSVSTAVGRAFARLGDRSGDPQPTRLVCLDLQKAEAAARPLWTSDAVGDDKVEAYFDADPIVVGDRVYVGVAHKNQHETTRFLHCFDFDGVPQWQTMLAEIMEFDARRTPRPGLLVAAGPLILNATQAGVVVAVDSGTGRRMWAFRYPSLDSATTPRGPSSCLAADGRAFLAPADSPNLYCLDAETGRTLWERPWTKNPSDIIGGSPVVSDVVDLLGMVGDRLIFTDRYRLQALDASTGGSLEWQQPSVGKLPAHGRGLIAGDWVFWPTADPEISWRAVTHAQGTLREADAEPEYYEPTTLRDLPAGNIAMGNGCLVVAGAKELVVYVPAARQLPALMGDPQAKVDPGKLFRMAMAEIENGRGDDAKATLAKIERIVPAAELPDWKNLIRERTSPPTPVKQSFSEPAASAKAKETPVHRTPFAPPTPPATKLVLAWGPVPGVAQVIEMTPGSGRNDIACLLDGPEVAFLDARTGGEFFRGNRRVARVDWLGRSGADFIVAGRDGVEAFDLNLRRATWFLEAPALAAARWRLIDERPRRVVPAERFGGFGFHGVNLVFAEDRRRAFALNPRSGKSAANVDRESTMQIGGHVAPIVSMRSWLEESDEFDVADLRRRHLSLSDGCRLLGEPRGVVTLVGSSSAKREVYEPPWPNSLTGGAANVFGDDSLCAALVPRNYGFDLIRFERGPFRPKWIVSATEFRDGFDVLAAAWDERALYFVQSGRLQARDLTDGSLLWKRDLPAANGPWKVERFGGGLIAWPQSAAGLPALSGPVDPFTAAVTLAVGRRGIGSVPILFVDANDGTVRQRLDVPHDAGPVFANVQGPRLVVSAGGQVRTWSAAP